MDRKARRLDPGQIEVIDDAMVEVLKRKSGAERLRIANGMFEMARQLVAARVRSLYPDWSDAQVRREVARRISHGAV